MDRWDASFSILTAPEFLASYFNRLARPGSVDSTRKMLDQNKDKWNIEYTIVDTMPVFPSATLIRVKFLKTGYGLSIQHAAMACGKSYAETALLDEDLDGLMYDEALGYGDVCRHSDVKDLEQDIQILLDKIHALPKTENKDSSAV